MDYTGCILLGAYLVIVALWWSVMTFKVYITSKTPDRVTRIKPVFSSRTWYILPFPKSQKFAIDPLFKLLLLVIFTIVELSRGHWKLFGPNGSVLEANIAPFSCGMILLMLCLSASLEFLSSLRKCRIPKGYSNLTLGTSFIVQGLLFHQRNNWPDASALQGTFAQMITVVSFITAGVVFMEIWHSNSISLSSARCSLVLLQATWYFQMAYSLYSPRAWFVNKANVMVVPILFVFHLACALIFILILYFFVGCLIERRRKRKDMLFDRALNHKNREDIPLSIVLNGHTNLSDDSDTT